MLITVGSEDGHFGVVYLKRGVVSAPKKGCFENSKFPFFSYLRKAEKICVVDI